jgi:hypothetical protein
MSIAPHAPQPTWNAGRSESGFTSIPNILLRILNHSERELWIFLKSYSRDGHVCMDINTLAGELGWCRRWTQRVKQRVIAKGCLLERPRFNAQGRQTRSRFELLEAPGGRVACKPPQIRNTQKAKDIEPAAARPAPPHRSPNRNIVASSRIARQFCEERRITPGWYRLNITRRIEALLNTGHEEAAIVAQFDREREAAAAPRKIPRRRMLERIRLAMRMREGQNLCTWPAAPAAELLENKAEEGEAERPAAPPSRVWRSAAQLKAAEERHAESRCRWKWFDERIQTDGAVHVEGRMCRTDEDILAVIRWLIPRSQLVAEVSAGSSLSRVNAWGGGL